MASPDFSSLNHQYEDLQASFAVFTRSSFSSPDLQMVEHEKLKAKVQKFYSSFVSMIENLIPIPPEIDDLEREIRKLKTKVSSFTLSSASPDSASSGESSPLTKKPDLDLSKLLQNMRLAAPCQREPSLEKPEEERSHKKARAALPPPVETPPFWGIRIEPGLGDRDIPGYMATETSSFPPSSETGIVEQVRTKDTCIKIRLKAALQAILNDYPEMALFNQLAITAEAVRQIAKISPKIWNEEVLAAVRTCLSDVDLEYPDFANPGGECPKEISEVLPTLREPAQRVAFEKWKVQLRSLLLAAPALIPSQMLGLATQSYHQIMKGLPYIVWSQEEAEVQIRRLYNFVK